MGGGDLPQEEPAPPARRSAEEARKPGEKREVERQMMMEAGRQELRSRTAVMPLGTEDSFQGFEAEQRFLSGILGAAGPSSEQKSG